jgi:hypothetical protein
MSWRMARSFPLTSLYIGAGLLIWAANFLVTYVFTAVACARGFASITMAGVRILVWVIVIATVSAILVAAWVAFKALSKYRARCARVGSSDPECFIHFTAAAVALLSMVAMAWTGFVAAVAFSCR